MLWSRRVGAAWSPIFWLEPEPEKVAPVSMEGLDSTKLINGNSTEYRTVCFKKLEFVFP